MRIRIRDPESIRTLDPGSGMEKFRYGNPPGSSIDIRIRNTVRVFSNFDLLGKISCIWYPETGVDVAQVLRHHPQVCCHQVGVEIEPDQMQEKPCARKLTKMDVRCTVRTCTFNPRFDIMYF
jgi:hypothetical protein